MVFYLIGLGLGNEDDITVKGLKIIQKCSRIYLEAYTSILGVDKDKLVFQFSSQYFFPFYFSKKLKKKKGKSIWKTDYCGRSVFFIIFSLFF